MARKLAAGNWKMNGTGAELDEARTLAAAHPAPRVEVLLCPPATLIHRMAEALGDGPVMIGAQDCHAAASGAHTGDLSAEMLAEAGATHVILGHSERRADHGETDQDVARKIEAARRAGLIAILCVGESEAQRDSGETLDVVSGQVKGSLPTGIMADGLVIAYEPVWAIGTGRTPTAVQIAEVHTHLRDELSTAIGSGARDVPLLYGGSVKPANAAEIFAIDNVDGALVGGASLKADDFSAIVAALEGAG
jgi:triosephosphate isomerase